MTFAHKLKDVMLKARARNPDGKMSDEQWLRLVNETAGAHFKRRKPQSVLERDKCVEALALATGTRDVAQITDPEQKVLRAALKSIRKVSTGDDIALIAEIQRRAVLFRDCHPTWPLTAMSLAKWWSHFGKPPPAGIAEPDCNWYERISANFSGTEEYNVAWEKLTHGQRNMVWQLLKQIKSNESKGSS